MSTNPGGRPIRTMGRGARVLAAVTALAAPGAALVVAPGVNIMRGGALTGSFVSGVRCSLLRLASPERRAVARSRVARGRQLGLGIGAPAHCVLREQISSAQRAPHLQLGHRSPASRRRGAVASSASLSPDFVLKTFAPLMVLAVTQCHAGPPLPLTCCNASVACAARCLCAALTPRCCPGRHHIGDNVCLALSVCAGST